MPPQRKQGREVAEDISIFVAHFTKRLLDKEREVDGPEVLDICNARIGRSFARCGLLRGHEFDHVPKLKVKRTQLTPDHERAIILQLIGEDNGGERADASHH